VSEKMDWTRRSDCLIIIPAYNEEETIEKLVYKAKRYGGVCVVNDCSSDSTLKILETIQDIAIISHEVNTHIPGAIIDGMKFAVENDYKYAVTIDAGMSHNPDEIPAFLEHEDSDLVIGSRVIKNNTPLHRRMLSLVGNCIYNICLDFPRGLWIKGYYKDISSGFRRYSNEAMLLLVRKELESVSFDFLFESTMLIHRNGLRVSTIPIVYSFSNSSLNFEVVKDCICMCSKVFFRSVFGGKYFRRSKRSIN
jgi:dolichol-phosphate mannosyltransferase